MAKRVIRLSDLKAAGPPSDRPVDVPQGGTWALWLLIVAGIVLLLSPVWVVVVVR
jgi:hypothetical protein